jgi:hypothetical protein
LEVFGLGYHRPVRKIKNLDGENFWHYIGKSDVPLEEPGHLSPVTGKEADFWKMTRGALEFARGSFATCSEEHNWYEHFELLMRHPVISAGVQIAAWHRYRLPEDFLSI